MRSLASRIGAMSADERAAMAAKLPTVVTIEGRALSVFNTCLVASQNPSVTVVGGFRQWIAAGRAVRKGEHGLALWVPIGKKDADGEASDDKPGFILGTVFDVSQTQEIETGAHVDVEPEAKPIDPIYVNRTDVNGNRSDYYSTEFTRIS